MNTLKALVAATALSTVAAGAFAADYPGVEPTTAGLLKALESAPPLEKMSPKDARQVLVDVLGKIPGPAAVTALARLAVFDIAPEVRDRAILALRDRPADSYSPVLTQGLRYPWPPAADHAAEPGHGRPVKAVDLLGQGGVGLALDADADDGLAEAARLFGE